MLYGNHDVVKSKSSFVDKYFQQYYCDSQRQCLPLFPGIEMEEGLILKNEESQLPVFLVHGHQGSLLNDTLWKLARWLVRYIWRPLETVGFTAPTAAGRPHKQREKIENQLEQFAKRNRTPLIAGHTHRPVFPSPGKGLYFNDGSCVHPRCITGIEIENDAIALVKWAVSVREDRSLYVGRQILEGPVALNAYRALNHKDGHQIKQAVDKRC